MIVLDCSTDSKLTLHLKGKAFQTSPETHPASYPVYWRRFPQGKCGQSMKIGTNVRLWIHVCILLYTFMAQCVMKYKDRNLPLLHFFCYVVNNVPDTYTLALAVICFFKKNFSLVFECHYLRNWIYMFHCSWMYFIISS